MFSHFSYNEQLALTCAIVPVLWIIVQLSAPLRRLTQRIVRIINYCVVTCIYALAACVIVFSAIHRGGSDDPAPAPEFQPAAVTFAVTYAHKQNHPKQRNVINEELKNLRTIVAIASTMVAEVARADQ